MPSRSGLLAPADLEQLAGLGVAAAEAERQLALLLHPPAPPVLERPATIGDGIEALDPARHATLVEIADEAARAGRVTAFVPASGAATRMFQSLLACRSLAGDGSRAALEQEAAAGRDDARATVTFLDQLERFAFHDALEREVARRGHALEALRARGPVGPLLDALLEPDGLDYAALPKGLLAFHRAPDGPRTPFEEHLAEFGRLFAGDDARVRLHFTVSPAHRAGFERLCERVRAPLEARFAVRFDVGFSTQHPATDTLAIGADRRPFREPDGRLLLRPAGHGALIENFADLGADLVFLKNVDNVAHDRFKQPTWLWTRLLVGRLAEVERDAHRLAAALARGEPDAIERAVAFARATFGATPPAAEAGRARWAADRLTRPLRVCGMVPNTGEPGGGPFWVRGEGGAASLQIVESAEVNAGDPAQLATFRRGTHFNPVFLACALRDRDGRAHDLARFVDPDAVILTRKSSGGRTLRALERPGLWNGAMSRWNTLFVEVPLGVFNPVKTVLDLLRPEHQP